MYSNGKENPPSVSIIIPTINRKNKLKKCLESIESLDYPKSLMEIIVVDNGSIDSTTEMVSSEFKNAKLVGEPRQGVSFARNTGVLHSKGEIISFLDDDCSVEKSWLKKIVRNFSDKDVIGVGGPVILRFNNQQLSQKIFDLSVLFLSFHLRTVGRSVMRVSYLSGANMSFRRKAFEFTYFDPMLGPPKAYLEDFDFCDNLTRLGFKLLYDPEAIVYHDPVVSRFNLSYILFERGPKEGLSLFFFKRKHTPWFKLLRGFFYNCIIRTFKLVVQRNNIDLIWLTWNFYAFWACLRMFNLPTRQLTTPKKQRGEHARRLN